MKPATDCSGKVRTLLLTVLLATFAFLSGALSVALESYRHRLATTRHFLESIPIRDDQRKLTIRKMDEEINQAVFFDDSTLLYSSGNKLVLRSLWDQAPLMEFTGHTEAVQDFEISPDRSRIVSSSEDGTLRLWDPLTGECLAVSAKQDTGDQPSWTMLHDIVYGPGGKTILSADMYGIKTWRTRDLKMLSFEESDLFYMCAGLLSPDGKTLCAPVVPDGLNIYERKSEFLLDHLGGREALCYSPDGKRLLAADREHGVMEIWDINPKTMREQRSFLWLNSPTIPLHAAAFNADGTALASAHGDGTVRIWNALNGAEREILHWEGRAIDGVCFSPSGSRVLAYSNKTGEYCLWGPVQWMI